MSIYRVSFLACGEVNVRTGLSGGKTMVVADVEPYQLCILLRQAFAQGLSLDYIEAFVGECAAQRLRAGDDESVHYSLDGQR